MLEMDPGYYFAYVNLGQALAAKRRSDAAIAEYQKARALNDDPSVLGLLAHAYAPRVTRRRPEKYWTN